MRIASVAVAVLALSGCGYALQSQITARYKEFVGRPVSDVVVSLGPPSSQFDVGPTTRAFQWHNSGSYQTPGVVNSIGNTVLVNPGATIATNCRVTFLASAPKRTDELSQWTVQSFEWQATDSRTCQ